MTARLKALIQNGIEGGTGGIDRGGVSGRAGAKNKTLDCFHLKWKQLDSNQ